MSGMNCCSRWMYIYIYLHVSIIHKPTLYLLVYYKHQSKNGSLKLKPPWKKLRTSMMTTPHSNQIPPEAPTTKVAERAGKNQPRQAAPRCQNASRDPPSHPHSSIHPSIESLPHPTYHIPSIYHNSHQSPHPSIHLDLDQ